MLRPVGVAYFRRLIVTVASGKQFWSIAALAIASSCVASLVLWTSAALLGWLIIMSIIGGSVGGWLVILLRLQRKAPSFGTSLVASWYIAPRVALSLPLSGIHLLASPLGLTICQRAFLLAFWRRSLSGKGLKLIYISFSYCLLFISDIEEWDAINAAKTKVVKYIFKKDSITFTRQSLPLYAKQRPVE